jgi:hypothetical protein
MVLDLLLDAYEIDKGSATLCVDAVSFLEMI